MFPSHEHEIGTIAFHLLATLDEYEQGIDRLVTRGWDPDLYGSTSLLFDQMKNYVAAFPKLSGAWVELLIRRFEMTALMWAAIKQGPDHEGVNTDLFEVHRQHNEAIGVLRSRARSFVPTLS